MLAQSATKKRLRQNEKEKPRKNELIEKMYEILHNTKKMLCTITHPKCEINEALISKALHQQLVGWDEKVYSLN